MSSSCGRPRSGSQTGANGALIQATLSDVARLSSQVEAISAAVVDHDGRDLAIDFVGAGIWKGLLLSATLPESAGLVAVLDEPVRNLHPTLQRRLRRCGRVIWPYSASPWIVWA